MAWHERMNTAVNYIEEHICEEADMKKISALVGQSPVNFQRTFSIVTNMSVYEYIRRRRLTLAAFELQNGKGQVVDIAAKYCYESPEAFARAFKEIHGIPPTAARKKGTELKSFPRITFLLTLKGVMAMDYRIETKEAFSVYGIEGIFTLKDNKNFKDIPKFWTECMNDGSFEKLSASAGGANVHALCDYRPVEGTDNFPYMLCVFDKPGCNSEGFVRADVPASVWAVFKTEKHTEEQTSDAIQKIIQRAYSEWLPTAGYNKLDGYDMELYMETDDGMYYSEYWIRVIAKG